MGGSPPATLVGGTEKGGGGWVCTVLPARAGEGALASLSSPTSLLLLPRRSPWPFRQLTRAKEGRGCSAGWEGGGGGCSAPRTHPLKWCLEEGGAVLAAPLLLTSHTVFLPLPPAQKAQLLPEPGRGWQAGCPASKGSGQLQGVPKALPADLKLTSPSPKAAASAALLGTCVSSSQLPAAKSSAVLQP